MRYYNKITDNKKKINNKRCMDCINFKTIDVTQENIYKFPYANILKVRKRIQDGSACSVYFCARNMLLRDCYLYTIYLEKIIIPTCIYFNKPEPHDRFYLLYEYNTMKKTRK